jgi:hypothetical protein
MEDGRKRTQFKKGQSGNPNGRPKKKETLTYILREYGKKKDITYKKKKITRQEKLCIKLWELALKGNKDCIKYIFDRIDGKPVYTVEQINQNTENPIYKMLCELTKSVK